jgi:hypothetical protein
MIRKILSMLAWLVVSMVGQQSVFAQTAVIDPWIFSPPPGAVRTVSGDSVSYTIGEEKFVLSKIFDITGQSVSVVADALLAELFPGNSEKVEERKELANGRFTFLKVTDGNRITAILFEKTSDGNGVAMAMYITNPSLLNKTQADRLVNARLRTDGAKTTAQQPLESSALVKQNEAWPKGGLVPATNAVVDWQSALKMGLDPKRNILPDTYFCFQSDLARAVTPDADGILSIQSDGRYDYTSDQVRGSGSWAQDKAAGYTAYSFSGVLTGKENSGNSYIQDNDYGQFFEIKERSRDSDRKDRELTCFQRGPSVEAVRIQMARGVLGQETMQCAMANGGQMSVQFGNKTYSSANGGGRFEDFIVTRSRGLWKGAFEFSSGPFKDAVGYLSGDQQGNRTLDIATYKTISAYLTTVNETDAVATCYGKSTPRPLPTYGNTPAPLTGMSGGISGMFTVPVSRWSGNISIGGHDVYMFTANGWYYSSVPDNKPIDCSKTMPSGEPICNRYEISGNKIRMQSSSGKWEDDDDWEVYKRSASMLEIDGREYKPLQPLTNAKLNGTYETASGSSSGSMTGVLYTSVTEGEIKFTADGRFESAKSTWNRLGIAVGALGAPPTVTGQSSNFDGNNGKGRFRIQGNWMILTGDDGREARKFIYAPHKDIAAGSLITHFYFDGDFYWIKK